MSLFLNSEDTLEVYHLALQIAVAQIDELCAGSDISCYKCPLDGKCKLCFFSDTSVEQFLKEARDIYYEYKRND